MAPDSRGPDDLSAMEQRDAYLIEQVVLAEPPAEAPLTAPVLLLGLGGTGAEILRRVKARAGSLGTAGSCRYLVVDLDLKPKAPSGSLPGFDDGEFCFINRSASRPVFRNPRQHPGLVERFDLKDPEIKQALANIGSGEASGAGQVRPLGLLAFHANPQLFRSRLDATVTDLRGRWKDLGMRLRSERAGGVGASPVLHVFVVASVAGGTGSSTLLDVVVQLRQALDDIPSQITGILALPDVFLEKVSGKIGEERRIKANAYATLHELDYLQSGQARSDGVRLLGIDETGVEAPEKLFDRTFLVSRVDAAGRDLGSMEAVFETVSLAISAEVAHTIGAHVQSSSANDAALQGLAKCVRSGKRRIYSTLGASALSVPILRILRFGTFSQMRDFLVEAVLGDVGEEQLIDNEVDAWLQAAQLEERTERGGDMVLDRLRQAAYAGPERYMNKLFQHRHQKATVYYKDKAFLLHFQNARQRWSDTDLADLKKTLDEQRRALVEEYRGSLATRESELIRTRGIRYTRAFLARLFAALSRARRELDEEAATCDGSAAEWDGAAMRALAPLRTFFGQFGTDKQRQETVASAFRKALDASASAEVRRTAASLLAALIKHLEKQLSSIRELAESCERAHDHYATAAVEYLPLVHSLPRTEEAEVDVTTREFLQSFYQKHKLTAEQMHTAIESKDPQKVVSTYRGLCDAKRESPDHRALLRHAATHFLAAARGITINDVLSWETQAGGGRQQRAAVRLEEAVRACRPLWRADIGVAGERYSDTVLIGMPESTSPEVQGRVREKLHEIEPSLNADNRYQAKVEQVTTHDPLRIYALRHSHGGLPFYLAMWPELRKAYQDWVRRGENPIHIFPRSVVERMPALEPAEDYSEGERAFALGVAYGWIAVRGSFYYYNLEKAEGSECYEALIDSQESCIAFEAKAPKGSPGALQPLTENGMFKFGRRSRPDRARKLGDDGGRAAGMHLMADSAGATTEIIKLYEEMRAVAGDDQVTRDLNSYIDELTRRYKPSDPLYEQVQKEIAILRRENARIKRRASA